LGLAVFSWQLKAPPVLVLNLNLNLVLRRIAPPILVLRRAAPLVLNLKTIRPGTKYVPGRTRSPL